MARAGKKRATKADGADVARKPRSHDWQKDEEEIDLEAKLFGNSRAKRPFVTSAVDADGESDNGLGDLDDDDLFEVDAPVAEGIVSEDEDEDDKDGSVSKIAGGSEVEEQESVDEEEGSEEEEDDEDEESEAESEASASSSGSSSSGASLAFEDDAPRAESSTSHLVKDRKRKIDPMHENDEVAEENGDGEPELQFPADLQTSIQLKKKGKCIWSDPSDEVVRIDVEAKKRTKKLGRGHEPGQISGVEYEKRLRKQFETLHPRPDWASNRIATGTPTMKLLLSSSKSFISAESGKPLQPGKLEIQRMLDANHQNPTTNRRTAQGAGKGVVDVAWHPSPKVGVMAVSGGDRRVRFFNIDGHTNPTLLTIHLPSLPLTKSTFHPSGSSLLLAGTRPYYYTYDLPSARCIRSPRNLFGSTPDASSPNSLTRHAFSPDGTMLAVAGRRGAVSILDWSGIGVGAVIADLRSGRGGSVVAMTWSRDSRELRVLGGRDGAEVEVWNVGERKVTRKWKDDRSFGGSTMDVSNDGEYTSIGCSTGIVNLYSSSSLNTPTPDASVQILPEPIKTLGHLTTHIASTAFHPSSEMLMTASNAKKNQVRVYHLPSASAYANWPTKTTPMGRVSNVSFAPSGLYLAAGSERGHVLLYDIKHYSRA